MRLPARSLSRSPPFRACDRKPRPKTAIAVSTPPAKLVEGARPLFLGGLRPLLEPAFGGSFRLDPRLVAQEPEQREVGVDLAGHHGFEVEFDKGLASQARVVAQDSQAAAVGEKAPEVIVGLVEELLDQAVGARPGGTGGAGLATTEVDAEADQVNERVLPVVRDSVRLAVDLDRLGRDQSAVAELLEQREQPFLARRARRRVGGRQLRQQRLEARPNADESVPGSIDRFVQLLALGQVVGGRCQAVESGIAGDDALEQIRGEDRSLRANSREQVAPFRLHHRGPERQRANGEFP